ncbi:MAG: universal stress protein [Verrucomicrobia bacterium]|nr:universal stress protein [Verrucomicrobiota bacterium]
MELSLGGHRPRNVDWKRAAALLYGDWGTSKAYVTGLAFLAAGFSSLWLILAVCALTGLVAINYAVICRHFPDGGGVYSAARSQGRSLAVIGALLLIADLTVTAALSGWAGLSYLTAGAEHYPAVAFLKEHIVFATIGILVFMGWLNWYGPKHSGSLAVLLSAPVIVVVLILIGISIPHLTLQYVEPPHQSASKVWVQFVGVILALSGVEAIANMTGVMKLDPGSTPEHPKVHRESAKAIWPIAFEVVFATAILGWAMLSLPSVLETTMGLHTKPEWIAAMDKRNEDMLRFMAEQFGRATIAPWFGTVFGWVVGVLMALLLLSAANTAIVAMVGLLFMMARDGEMPAAFTKLNRHGVPLAPVLIAVGLPIIVLLTTSDFTSLAGLYAIGVVGAITVNLGSCAANRVMGFTWYDRVLFAFTFLILFAVEITLARTKPDALFFVLCVLGLGFALRTYAQKRAGLTNLTVSRELADIVTPESIAKLRPRLVEGQKIMVAARGVTPVLRFALDEAQLRKATLCVLYVKELAVFIPQGPATTGRGRPKWQDDPQAAAIMSLVMKAAEDRQVDVMPIYAVSDNPAGTILDLAATLGIDYLMLGSSHRMSMTKILKGNVIAQVAAGLPEDIQLIIHG